MSTTVDNQIVNLQFNNKNFEKNAKQSLETTEKLKKSLNFDGVKTGFEAITQASSKTVSSLKNISKAARSASDTIKSAFSSLSNIGKTITFGPITALKSAFDSIQNSINPMKRVMNFDNEKLSFSALEQVAVGALRRIGEQAVNAGERLTKSLTVDQVSAGWEKFGEKTRSVASIMAATGMSVEDVSDKLKKLNWYTDETSYAYTDMTNNIGKFTNAGIELDDAITAMIGIGNAAGLAGSSVQDASHAMSGFSKAMAKGYMDRQNWSWIETAHLDTVQFKNSLIEAGEELGTIGKGQVGLDDFIGTLTDLKWLTSDVMVRALKEYGGTTELIFEEWSKNGGYTSDVIERLGISSEDLGLKAFKASQEARTFADAIDSVKDAVSTGFMTVFEHLIGNYEEAKEFWTDLANNLWDVFADPISQLNDALDTWDKLGGHKLFRSSLYKFMDTTAEYIARFKEGVADVFGALDADRLMSITNRIYNIASAFESTINDGKLDFLIDIWTNFLEIIDSVTDAFDSVGNVIDEVLIESGLKDTVEDISNAVEGLTDEIEEVAEVSDEVKERIEKSFQAVSDIWNKGLYGTGDVRYKSLESLGLDPKYVQQYLNKIARGQASSLDEIHELMLKDTSATVKDVIESSEEAIDEIEETESAVVKLANPIATILGGIAGTIRRIAHYANEDDQLVRIFGGVLSVVKLVNVALDQFSKIVSKNSLARDLTHAVIDPIARLADKIRDVANGNDIYKIRSIINQIGIIGERVGNILRLVSDSFSRAFGEVFGDIKIFDIANRGLSSFADILSSVFTYLSENDRLTRIIKGWLSSIKIFYSLVVSLAKVLKPVIKTVFIVLVDVLANIADVLSEIASENGIDGLGKIFESVFGVIGTAVLWVYNLVVNLYTAIRDAVTWTIVFFQELSSRIKSSENIAKMAESFEKMKTAISELFKSFSKQKDEPTNAIKTMVDVAKEGDDSFAWLDGVVGVIDTIAGGFNSLVDGISNVISWVDQFIDKIQGNGDSDDIVSGEAGKTNIFTSLSEGLSNVFTNTDAIQTRAGSSFFFGNVLSGIGDAINNFFKNTEIDWSKLKNIAALVAIIWSFIEFRKAATTVNEILKNVSKIPTSFGDIFTNLNESFVSVKGAIDQAKTSLKQITSAQVISSYIYALLALAAGVVLLGSIPEDELSQGVAAMAILGVFFAVFAKSMSKLSANAKTVTKITNSGNKTFNFLSGNTTNVDAGSVGIALILLSFAAFSLAIVSALKQVAEIPNDQGRLMRGVGILAGMLVLIGAILIVIEKIGQNIKASSRITTRWGTTKSEGPSGYFTSVAIVIGAIALAIKALTNSVVKLSGLTPEQAVIGVFSMLGIVAMLVGVIAALGVIIERFQKMGYLNADKMIKQMSSLSLTMTVISLAIDSLIPIIAAFAVISALDQTGIGKGNMLTGALLGLFSTMAILVVAVGALMAAVSKIHFDIPKLLSAVGAMVVTALAVDALIPVILMFGILSAIPNVNVVAIAGSVALVIVALGAVIAGVIAVTKISSSGKILSAAFGILVLALAVGLVMQALTSVATSLAKNNIATSALIDIALIMGGALLAMSGVLVIMMALVNNMANVPDQTILTIAGAIVAMAGAVLIIAAAFGVLSRTGSPEQFTKYAIALGVFIGALLALVVAFTAIAANFPVVIPVLKAMVVLFASIAGIVLGVASGILFFGLSLKLVSESLPEIYRYLPGVSRVVGEFLDTLSGHELTLIAAAIAFAAFAIIVTGAVAVMAAIIIAAFNSLNSSGGLPKIGKTTMLMVAGIILGICAAIANTSPAVLETMEGVFIKIAAYLGEITGTLAEMLLVFVLDVLESLADAIDRNSGSILWVLYRICESIVMLLVKAINMIFAPLLKYSDTLSVVALKHIYEFVLAIDDVINSVLIAFASVDPYQDAEYVEKYLNLEHDQLKRKLEEQADAFANLFSNDTIGVGLDVMSELHSDFNVGLRQTLGLDEEKAEREARADGKNLKDTTEKYAYGMVKEAGDGLKTGVNKAVSEVEIPNALQGLIDKVTDGGSIDLSKLDASSLMSKYTDKLSGTLDVNSMLGDLSSLQSQGLDTSAILGQLSTEYGIDISGMSQITGGYTSDMNTDWSNWGLGISSNVDGAKDSMATYVDSVATTSEDAVNELDGGLGNALIAIRSFDTPFYQAGVTLIDKLQEGMDYQFNFAKNSLVGHFNQMLREAGLAWEISSPSKKFESIGEYGMLGLAKGLENKAYMPIQQFRDTFDRIDNTAKFGSFAPHITPVIDMTNARTTANEVDTLFKTPMKSVELAADANRYVNAAFDFAQNSRYNDTNVVGAITDLRTDVNALNEAMANTNVYLDTGALVGSTVGPMNAALGRMSQRTKRGG